MARDKSSQQRQNQPARERILDAAERLLGQGSAAFSMRELAEAAGLSFATPFNHFGSKAAIMLALSARRIDTMSQQFAQARHPDTSVGRVIAAVDIATSVMLSTPAINRAVMGAIGAPSEEPGDVSSHSAAFWIEALGTAEGLASSTRQLAMVALPAQLAAAFRGVLSFWTAGELSDQQLPQHARAAAAAVLLGFAGREGRNELLVILRATTA